MKSNNAWIGGYLKPEYYQDFAQYFVKYIESMAAQGINIWGSTAQNEPENARNEPSMEMTAEEQFEFINFHLGPQLADKGYLNVKILGFDHNVDNVHYPIQVAQSDYVDGSAFHLYAGDISTMSIVKNATNKDVYLTEQWIGLPTGNNSEDELIEAFNYDLSWHMENVMIGSIRNWSKAVLEWNLVTSPEIAKRGCITCMGTFTLGEDTLKLDKNVSYYSITQLSKYL